MKLWKIAGAVSAAVLLVSAAGLAACRTESVDRENRTGEDKDSAEVVKGGKSPPVSIQEELYERLGGFAEILYQYDTNERKFYEGAEAYMTDEAFHLLLPLGAVGRNEGEGIRVQSSLISTDIYAYYSSDASAEVIMESRFTLSRAANCTVTQYLELSVEKTDGQWMITECHVIDTLEE